MRVELSKLSSIIFIKVYTKEQAKRPSLKFVINLLNIKTEISLLFKYKLY